MVRVGIAGFGFMGRTHLRCYRELPKVQVVAICDGDKSRLATKKTAGNIGQTDTSMNFADVALYTDFDKMLAKECLDAVSITLPTFMHKDFTIKALKAGVHVLCEKPMAMNVSQCRQMMTAAQANKKTLQIGHCIRFWPEYAKAKQIVDSGRYGKVLAASFRRIGAVPGWSWKNWLINQNRSGGAIMDLHIHDADFIQFLFGLPLAVKSQGVVGPSGGFDYVATQYVYKDRKVVVADGGFVMSAGFAFEMSFNIILEKATIVYDCTRTPVFCVYPAKGKRIIPKINKGDGWSREIEHFIKRITGKKAPSIISPLDSLNAVKIVLAEKRSAETKREVKIR